MKWKLSDLSIIFSNKKTYIYKMYIINSEYIIKISSKVFWKKKKKK